VQVGEGGDGRHPWVRCKPMLFFNSSALYLASRKSKVQKVLAVVGASLNREGSLQVDAILFLLLF